jgi:hypothetical protein
VDFNHNNRLGCDPEASPPDAAMSATPSSLFNLNGVNYDASQLPAEGQRLLALLGQAQAELARLDTQQQLIKAARQQLINELKPLLPSPVGQPPVSGSGPAILGQASDRIPTTPVEQPSQEPAPLPDNLPPELIRQQANGATPESR